MGPTGPTGATGPAGSASSELLSAYSIPAQEGTAGAPLVFDRNGVTNGTSITHDQNSGSITLQQPGLYEVSFHGTVGGVSGAAFPTTVSMYLKQQGNEVPGTAVQHTLSTASDTSTVSFSQIVDVTAVPATLQVIGQGSSFLYGPAAITVSRLGDSGTTS